MTTRPFGKHSELYLSQAHPDLQFLFRQVNNVYQCTILSGGRTITEQQALVKKGLSKTMNSKHLIQKDGFCWALDVAPDPVDFERKSYNLDMIYFAGRVFEMARQLGIDIIYGGDWNENNLISDTSFLDLDHFELASVRS